jgi:hypothetical protein
MQKKISILSVLHLKSRVTLGLILLIFGLNGFYTFIAVPELHPFMEILVSSGYIYVIKTTEIFCGILLLSNRYIPLALIMIMPILVNITAYHLLLDPRNSFLLPFLWLFSILLFYKHRQFFKAFISNETHIISRS